jgi:hypothetical protein
VTAPYDAASCHDAAQFSRFRRICVAMILIMLNPAYDNNIR